MASVRKSKTVRGDGRGANARATYADIMRDEILTGRASSLVETTAADGNQVVPHQQFDVDGNPTTIVNVTVPVRRLVTLEYDDPKGNAARLARG